MKTKYLLLTLGGSFLSACSLAPTDVSHVQISMPPGAAVANLATGAASASSLLPFPGQEVSGLTAAGGGTNFSPPLLMSDFGCFAVMVTGPGVDADPRLLTQCDQSKAATPIRLGLIAGFAPVSGGTVDLDIPSGNSRLIQLLALQIAPGTTCPTINDVLNKAGTNDDFKLGDPYEIGRVQQDIFADQSIEIKAKFTAPGTVAFRCGNDNNGSISPSFANIAGFNPGMVSPASGGILTINGSSFQPGATVLIAGAVNCPVIDVSPTVIHCTAPPHAPGFVSASVTNPGSTPNTLAQAFGYTEPGVALGQGNPFTNGSGVNPGLSGPRGVAVDASHLYVADTGNNRILVWNNPHPAMGQVPDLVLGQTSMSGNSINFGGISMSSMYAPQGVYSDGTKLFVADTGNNRVLVWNSIPNANGQAADLVLGQSTGSGSTSSSSTNGMSAPASVSGAGNYLAVADTGSSRVLFFSIGSLSMGSPAYSMIGQASYGTSTPSVGVSSLNLPRGVMMDGSRVYVADTGNNRVLIWNIPVPTLGSSASVVLGQAGFAASTSSSGVNGLSSPTAVFAAPTGKFFVADTGNKRIMVWSSVPAATVGANYVIGQPDFVTATPNTGGLQIQSFLNPGNSIFVDAASTVYVPDSGNHRVTYFTY